MLGGKSTDLSKDNPSRTPSISVVNSLNICFCYRIIRNKKVGEQLNKSTALTSETLPQYKDKQRMELWDG